MQLDHVLIAVTDLSAAARRIESRHGLASVDGGRHPGRGTANRIVPLGESYLELIAVVDEAEASGNVSGRWVKAGASQSGSPIGWVVRTNELDAVARRLGVEVTAGSRMTPEGRLLRWRSAGVEQAAREPSLPFFIQWDKGVAHPGSAEVAHRVAPSRISRLELRGDAARLDAWLGPHSLPVEVSPGPPRVSAVVVATASGEVVFGRE